MKITLVPSVLLGLALAVSSAEATAISVEPSVLTVSAGDTFSISIDLDDITDLFAYQFGFMFDSTFVNVTAVTEGAFLGTVGSTFFGPGSIDNVAGSVAFIFNTLIGPVAGATGGGTLVNIELQALNAGVSGLQVVFDPLNGDGLIDTNLNPIDFATEDPGLVTVTGVTAPVPEPTSAVLLVTGLAAVLRMRKSSVKE